jgi:hypothetical protein
MSMKKRIISISVLSIVFSLMFLVVSSGTKAEMQEGAKKDLISALHFESTSLIRPKNNSVESKDRESNSLPTVFVPLKKGLHAFLDLTSPPHQGPTPKDSRTDYRAVVGFHFVLR